jgi:hypothetical protein
VEPPSRDNTPGHQIAGEADSATGNYVQLVFDIWRVHARRDGTRVELSDKRRKLIEKALDGYDLQTVLDAAIGWRYSEFHIGQNDRHKAYNSLELLLRDSAHIEQFAGYTRAAGVSAPTAVPVDAVDIPDLPEAPEGIRLGLFEYAGEW